MPFKPERHDDLVSSNKVTRGLSLEAAPAQGRSPAESTTPLQAYTAWQPGPFEIGALPEV